MTAELARTSFPGRYPRNGPCIGSVTLPLEVSETDREIVITAELSGVEEKDVEATLSNDLLTIKGEKKSETQMKEKGPYMAERRYGAFSRSLRPCYPVDDPVGWQKVASPPKAAAIV